MRMTKSFISFLSSFLHLAWLLFTILFFSLLLSDVCLFRMYWHFAFYNANANIEKCFVIITWNKKKQKKMYGHFCCCYSQCHFFKICFCINMYKCVQNRFQLFANVFFFLLLFWTLWSCVKRASMTATWMRVFLLIRFRIKIQWTFIHTFLSSSDSVCCFEIKTEFSFVY